MTKSYKDLQKATKKLAKKIKKEVEISISASKRRYQDYPAMVVSCYDDVSKKLITSDSSKSNFHGSLNARLRSTLISKLGGDYGQISSVTNSKNRIGCCAEVHSANKLIKIMKCNCKICNIEFSKPIRPRTMQVKKYCENCKKVFPKLKNK